MKKVVAVICWVCLFFEARTQEIEQEVEQLMEDAALNSGEEEVELDWLEQLQELGIRKINLNVADRSEMAVFPWLSDWHITQLIAYRSLFGPMLSVYELQAVPGWSVELIRKLRPYLRWGHEAEEPWNLRWTKGDRRLSVSFNLVVQPSRGFLSVDGNDPVYGGKPWKWQLRYRYQYRKSLQWGLTMEKDAGEMFIHDRKLNGFASAHLQLTAWKGIAQLNLGDFTVNMGQGLIQWQGMGAGAGGNATSIYRQAPLVKAHTSAGEHQFYRGGAFVLKKRKLSFTGYSGLRKFGAMIDTVDGTRPVASAMNYAGTYRTETEMSRKGELGLWALGGAMQWEKDKWRIILNWAGLHWQHALKKSDEPYQVLKQERRIQHAFSLSASYVGKAAYFFGEGAVDANLNPAFTSGMLMIPLHNLELAVLLRAISPRYQVWNGSIFGASAQPSNEYGIYTGLKYTLPFKIVADLWWDVYHRPWLKYRVSAPGTGTAFSVRLTGKPDRNTEWRVAYRVSIGPQNNESLGGFMETPDHNRLSGVKLYWSISPDRNWQHRMRFEFVQWRDRKQASEMGSLWLTEVRWMPPGKRYYFDGRVQYFQTDSYQTRLYALEKDIPFQQGVPAFYGKGWRGYLLTTCKFGKSMQCWFRVSHTLKPDVTETGSGHNTVEGSARTELSFQWQILF